MVTRNFSHCFDSMFFYLSFPKEKASSYLLRNFSQAFFGRLAKSTCICSLYVNLTYNSK